MKCLICNEEWDEEEDAATCCDAARAMLEAYRREAQLAVDAEQPEAGRESIVHFEPGVVTTPGIIVHGNVQLVGAGDEENS